MTVIEPPKGPGTIVSRWRTEGPVDSDTLMAWKDELDWPSWLSLAEAALFMDAPELLEAMQPHLSPGEEAVLGLIRRRWLGDTHLGEAIEAALAVVRNPDTRDLALEGRLRMERGLFRFEAGDAEGAEDDLTWAETRLKSVAKASRDHDLSLLNKAAYHMAQGEALMALQVYGDISRTAGHAHETIAISRLGASRIRMDWAICLMPVGTHGMHTSTPSWPFNTRWPSKRGPCFWTGDWPPIYRRSTDARPRRRNLDLEYEPPTLAVHPDDIHGVFDWCVEHLEKGWGGPERPAVRAMLTLAHRLEKMDRFATLMASPEQVQDPMLAAVAQACSSTPEETAAWGKRLAELTML